MVTNGQAYPQQFSSLNRYWLRITRVGDQFSMYVSSEGQTWYVVGAQSIPMDNCIQIGMAVTNNTPNTVVTATFTHVSINGSGKHWRIRLTSPFVENSLRENS
ncbi:MAG: hypothetical protein IPN33_20660 [Saprospiraceae bacterium]|nr:hypothetical protein [Saprospiraceae bacterium]